MCALKLSNGAEYAFEFVEGLSACYTCTNCHQFLGEPYQNVECGDRFCADCVRLITNGVKKCPECSALMTRETTFVDVAVRREIDGLGVCCPFKRYGCEQTFLYGDVKDHIEACSKNPVRTDASAANGSSAATTALENRVERFEKMFRDVQLQLDGVSNQVNSLVLCKCNNAMRSGNGHVPAAPTIGEVARRLGEWLENQLSSLVFWRSNSTLSPGDGVVGAARQNGEISRRFQTPEEIAQGASPVHGSISAGANEFDTGISRLTASLQEVSSTVDRREQTNDYGLLIWKIDNFRRRKNEALGVFRQTVYSPIFYSRQGYKMGAYVYLNGDVVGRNEYLSPFFFLMKGEYDSLLDFPFRLRVKFTLLDQESLSCNLSDYFDPDPTSLVFQRPAIFHSLASGLSRFVRQSVVETPTYLKDDCIYLRIDVGRD